VEDRFVGQKNKDYSIGKGKVKTSAAGGKPTAAKNSAPLRFCSENTLYLHKTVLKPPTPDVSPNKFDQKPTARAQPIIFAGVFLTS